MTAEEKGKILSHLYETIESFVEYEKQFETPITWDDFLCHCRLKSELRKWVIEKRELIQKGLISDEELQLYIDNAFNFGVEVINTDPNYFLLNKWLDEMNEWRCDIDERIHETILMRQELENEIERLKSELYECQGFKELANENMSLNETLRNAIKNRLVDLKLHLLDYSLSEINDELNYIISGLTS